MDWAGHHEDNISMKAIAPLQLLDMLLHIVNLSMTLPNECNYL